MPRNVHNPLPASLRSECRKAQQILESFIDGSFTGSPGKEMPARFLGEAKGLAIITITRAGFLGSIRLGSGILIARLPDGSWSAPSGVATAGLGIGGQFGMELTDFVFLLNERALHTFSRTGSLTLSGNISIAFGPFGRSAEISAGASGNGLASMFSYSKTVGMYGGLTVEGGMLVERKSANRKFYKTRVTADQLLKGEVVLPAETQPLMRVLGHKMFDPSAEMETREVPVSREIAQQGGATELSVQGDSQQPSELPVDSNHCVSSPNPSPQHENARDAAVMPELDGTPCTPEPAELPSESNARSSSAELPAVMADRPARKPLQQEPEQSSGTHDAEPTIGPSPETAIQPGTTEKLAEINQATAQPRPEAFVISA